MSGVLRVVPGCMASFLFAVAAVGSAYDIPAFTQQLIDPGQAPWGKQLADLDGDGFVDIVEAGGYVNNQKIYWYRYPDWTRFQIGSTGGDDDLQVGDINGDGAPDVVVNGGIYWYENPRGSGGDVTLQWTRHTADASINTHDLALGDIDRDGMLDIVTRGAGDSGPTYILFQNTPDSWTRVQMTNAPIGEGLALADIDRDGRTDLVGNGYWLRQPANPRADAWPRYDFASWASIAAVGTADLNRDGRLDIVLAPSETGPGTLAWFEAPADPTAAAWTRHDIMSADDLHRFHMVDVNLDGERDIVFGEMHQSDFKRLGVLYNDGLGSSWTLQVLGTGGAHNIAVGDIGSDGDLDILTANWNVSAPDGGAIYVWINHLDPPPPDTTPPTVALIAPANDAVVSGTVAVVAEAADDVAVACVRFRLDGAALGDEITTAPYALAWDTTTVPTGAHTLAAVARDGSGNATTSTLVTVTVTRWVTTSTRYWERYEKPRRQWDGVSKR